MAPIKNQNNTSHQIKPDNYCTMLSPLFLAVTSNRPMSTCCGN